MSACLFLTRMTEQQLYHGDFREAALADHTSLNKNSPYPPSVDSRGLHRTVLLVLLWKWCQFATVAILTRLPS